ncbi:hypothetical protein ScalyP_jg3802, partial [Parmales sp. scaly parma]
DTYVDEQRLYSAFSTVRNALMLELEKHSETVKLIEKLKVQLVLEEEVNVMQHEQLKKEEKHTALISGDYNHLVKEHTLIMECSEDEIEDLYRQIRDVKSAVTKKQFPSLLTGSLSLALRLGSAVTVAGWSPKVGLSDPNEDEYSLKLGPLFLSDRSCLSPSDERGIKTPLILYEYEPSPFCKKVREILCFLDIPCEFRPCPRQKGFSDELFERTGRRTVPYLRDPNNEDPDYGMFESEEIIDYLLKRYGEGAESNFSQRGNFATVTAGLSSVARGLAGGTLDNKARPDNNLMAPITLFGNQFERLWVSPTC